MAHKPSKVIRKHDWPALRQEFVTGEWNTIADFLKDKGMSVSYIKSKQLSGVVTEKTKFKNEADEKAIQAYSQGDVEDAVKVRLRQARLARFMQLRGAEALKEPSLKINSAEDARKLLTAGLEQERKALGIDGGGADKPNSLTQNNISINVGPKTQLDRMMEGASYEDILGLIAELKRSRQGSTLSETAKGSATEAERSV